MGLTPVRAATANRRFRFVTSSWTEGDERTGLDNHCEFEQRIGCSPHAMIRGHDSAGDVIEARKHAAELKSCTTARLG